METKSRTKIILAVLTLVGTMATAAVTFLRPDKTPSPSANNNNSTSVTVNVPAQVEHKATAGIAPALPGTTASPNSSNPPAAGQRSVDLEAATHLEVNAQSNFKDEKGEYILKVFSLDFAGEEVRVNFEATGPKDLAEPFHAYIEERPYHYGGTTEAIKAPLTNSEPGHYKGYASYKRPFFKKGFSYYLRYSNKFDAIFLFSVRE